jgi:hypothetical protein
MTKTFLYGWTVFGLLLIPSLAFSQANQAWWQVLLTHLIEIAAVVLTPALIVVSRAFAASLAKKANIELAERQFALLDDLVNKGVSFAHEQGRKALKSNGTISAEDKKAAAVNFVAQGINHLGLPGAGQELLTQFVEAKLNLRRDDPVKAGELAKTNAGRIIPT